MATYVKNDNQSSTWQVAGNGDTWVVGKDARFTIANGYAVSEASSSDYNAIRVFGAIEVSGGGGTSGVIFQGAHSSVLVGASGFIQTAAGSSGIHSNSAGGAITVNGAVHAGSYAIVGSKWGVVKNNGELEGIGGILFAAAGSTIENNGTITAQAAGGVKSPGAGSSLLNSATGAIRSDDDGVVFTGLGHGQIINHGLIKGGDRSIEDGDGTISVINRGTLKGAVSLGGGDDYFDTARGKVVGVVYGGSGDDFYKLGASSAAITELVGGGYDIVSSTIDRVLASQVEELRLVGKGDIDGTGNETANLLRGNSGNNRLFGLGGDDTLSGGRGRDVLNGGAGADIFVFNSGDGRDRIVDFEDGFDHLDLDFVQSLQDFNALLSNHLVESGDNLIITYGADRLVLRNMDKAELTYSDFLIS